MPSALRNAVKPAYERVELGRYGLSTFVKAGSRFYPRGITGYREPLLKSGGVISGLSGILLDVVHFVLLLAGAFFLYRAIIL